MRLIGKRQKMSLPFFIEHRRNWQKVFLFLEKDLTKKEKSDILYRLEKNNEVWLSLVERYVRDVEAASSNLVTSTNRKRR